MSRSAHSFPQRTRRRLQEFFLGHQRIFIVYTVSMKTEAQMWGNSLAIRIPKAFAREIGLGVGAVVELEISTGRLVIIPERKKGYELRSLLAQVKRSNQHSETDWGNPIGQEVW